MRISIFLYIFLFIFQSSAIAASGVEQYVDNIINEASSMLSDSNLSESQKISQSRSLLAQNLDFEWMGKHVLGRKYSSLTPQQQSTFNASYKRHVINSYSSLVKKYNGQQTVVNGVNPGGGSGEYIVQTTVEGGGRNINVNYRVHQCGGGYKISDIITEGVSLMNTQQEEFTSILNNEGLDSLLQKL